jgi:hypothetical protein
MRMMDLKSGRLESYSPKNNRKMDRPVEALGMPTTHPSLRFRVARFVNVSQLNNGTKY